LHIPNVFKTENQEKNAYFYKKTSAFETKAEVINLEDKN